LKSDLARVDAHVVKKDENEDLPELTEEMLARAKVNKGAVRFLQIPASYSLSDCQSTSLNVGRRPVRAGKRAWLSA
jgi:hypothetical protein